MRRLRKLLALPGPERLLLVKAALLLLAIRLGLWVLRFRIVRSVLARLSQGRDKRPDAHHLPPDKIVWAVEVVGHHVPGTKNCLVRALATDTLLARHGRPSRLRIGVARGDRGELEAHAWVEGEGKILIGAMGAELFTPLPAFEREGQ